ncbi:hypothetical protein FEM08_34570 [Flavobacterium gilvum]|nr:hypothetical protein FEM08_34570 [Flavobacterium gilvum]
MIQYEGGVSRNYMVCFIFYMMAVGVVVGTAFPDLSNQIKTSNYLLCPGSSFEKLMVQFLLRIGLFVPIALGIFWIVIRLAKASLTPGESGLDLSLIPYFEFRFLVSNYKNELDDIWKILFMIFGFLSYGIYLFAGTTYFKRYALIKTVIVSVVLWGTSVLFVILLSHIFYPENHGFGIILRDFVITEHLDSSQMFALLFSLFSWMFFLAIAYFKLKEREA